MALLFSFASCDNGSTSGGKPSQGGNGSQDDISQSPGIDYSLGTPPDENLKIPDDKITAEENCADGIYIKYAIPQGKNVQSCTACIDGIGLVYENYGLEGESEGELFYPFVTPGKEYTVRFVFNSKEIERDGWNYGGAECVGWFDAKAKAGSKSKGEVRLTDKGEIEVKANGDFRFTKRPAFEGESRLDANGGWYMNVCLVEGVSWLHDDRKTKWRGELNVPSAERENTINLYTYDENDSWRNGGDWEIDFLCIRPRMKYTYDDKEYTYQWDGFTEENLQLKPKAELWSEIDVSNPADVKKIVGTWNRHFEDYRGYGSPDDLLWVNYIEDKTLIIDSMNVTATDVSTYTKADGDAFTKDDLLKLISYYDYYGETGNGIAASKVEDFEKTLDNESRVLKFEKILYEKGDAMEETFYYRIYYLDSNTILSDNMRTITKKYDGEPELISEYFADDLKHYGVELFDNGTALRIVDGHYENGDKHYIDYKKQ